MTILIDHRAGSEELICHSPFNVCRVCHSTLIITRREVKKQKRIVSAVCSANPSHRLLGTLTPLAKLNRDRQTSPDVYFTGNGPEQSKSTIAIEIKRVDDLLASIISGRLPATQIPDLLTYDHPWLAWYGAVRERNGILQLQFWHRKSNSWQWADYKTGRKTYPLSFLENFLDSPSITNTHLRVKHYRTLPEIAHWIGNCYYPLWQKPYTSHNSLNRFDDTLRLPSNHLLPTIDEHTYQLMLFAAANPGIKFERAFGVANHFDSALDMFNADADEWANIKIRSKTGRETRIGPARAQAIVNAIRRRRSAK